MFIASVFRLFHEGRRTLLADVRRPLVACRLMRELPLPKDPPESMQGREALLLPSVSGSAADALRARQLGLCGSASSLRSEGGRTAHV